MITDCTALILAGGESRRMGQDKANIKLGNQTLLQHVSTALHPLFSDIIVSTRQVRLDCDMQQVTDNPIHAGPLAGLAAGLEQARTPWVFAVACDMPFITAALVVTLAGFRDHVDAVVPVVAGFPQPLAAFYSRHSLGALREILIGDGSHSMRALLDRLNVRYVNETELQAIDCFFDLDTPQDLALAINMAGMSHPK